MAEEVVLIRFKGEDDASGVAETVSRSVDDIGDAAGKTSGSFSSMGSVMTGVLQGVGQHLANFALDLGSKALGAVTDFIGGSIEEASQWNAVLAQTQAVVDSTGGAANFTALQLAEMAQEMSATAGQSIFSDDAILGAENVLATFTNIEGRQFGGATQAVLDISQALGQDLKSSSIQVGKALNDPVAGISALSRVGVSFTDEQKALIETMTKTGDVAGAQQVILDELAKEFGGSASAAVNTYAGQQVVLQEKLNDIKQTLGEALMPLLMQAGSFMADTLVPILSSAITSLSAWLSSAETSSTLTAIFDAIGAAISSVPGYIDAAGAALQTFAGFMQPVTDAATTFGAVAIPILMQAGAAITEYLASPTAQGYLATLSTFLLQLATTARDILAAAFTAVTAVWQGLAAAFTVAWPTIQVILDGLYTLGSTVLSFLTGMLQSVSLLLKGDFAGAWDTAKTASVKAFGELWTFMEGLGTKFKTFFDTIKTQVVQIGSDIANGIATGITDGASWILNALTAAVQAAWNAATGWLSGASSTTNDEGGGDRSTRGRSALAENQNGNNVTYNFTANYAGAQSESSLISDVQALMALNGAAL